MSEIVVRMADSPDVRMIDEIVAQNATVHLEQMGLTEYTLIVETTTERACFSIHACNSRSHIRTTETWKEPVGSGTYSTDGHSVERTGAQRETLTGDCRICGCDYYDSIHDRGCADWHGFVAVSPERRHQPEEEKKDGGTSLTAVESVSVSAANQLSHDATGLSLLLLEEQAAHAETDRRRLESERMVLDVLAWAESRCPCEAGLPNPCTVCGARSEHDHCMAADATFPGHLLRRMRSMVGCAPVSSTEHSADSRAQRHD